MHFSRKNVRGKPGPTERVVGAGVLVLLALIVGTFLLTSGLFSGVVNRFGVLRCAKDFVGVSECPLFVAEPEPGTTPPASRIADAALPEIPSPWQRLGVVAQTVGVGQASASAASDVQQFHRLLAKVSASDLLKTDGEWRRNLQAFDVQWMYRGLYRKDAGSQGDGPGRNLVAVVSVMDVGNPQKALGLWQARKPAGATNMPIGRAGWRTDRPNACAFWSGRHYSEIVACDEMSNQDRESLARAIASAQLAYGGPFDVASAAVADEPQTDDSSQNGRRKPRAIAQFADVGNETILPPTKIERYTDNLYEKINGREGQFLAFHFVELRFAQYLDTKTKQGFDAYIYDMGLEVNAFGVYMSERSGAAGKLDLGRDGYLSGTSAYFVKDKYYVNVLGPPEGDELAIATSKRIASAIAETIPGQSKPFWAEALLPAENRKPHTLAYRATSALGYDFLERMFLAGYELDGQEYQIFLLKAESPASAKTLFGKFAEATAKYDKIISRKANEDGETLVSDSLGIYSVVFHKGPYFAGVIECEDQALAAKKAAEFRLSLPAEEPATNKSGRS